MGEVEETERNGFKRIEGRGRRENI